MLAAVALAVAPRAGVGARRASAPSRAAVADVAEHLGNTPAVCRASYIDPRVFDRYARGRDDRDLARRLDELEAARARAQRRIETSVLRLLEGD